MAKLSKAERDKLPDSAFAGPNRTFPVHDKAHAEAALQDLPKAQAAGSINAAQAHRIRMRANEKLGKADA